MTARRTYRRPPRRRTNPDGGGLLIGLAVGAAAVGGIVWAGRHFHLTGTTSGSTTTTGTTTTTTTGSGGTTATTSCPAGSFRRRDGRVIDPATLTSELHGANYPGPWDLPSEVAAYSRADPAGNGQLTAC